MKKSLVFLALIAISLAFCCNKPAWCWDHEVTHRDLTNYAIDQSILAPSKGDYLRAISLDNFDEVLFWSEHVCDDKTHQIDCSVKDWLKYGAEKEDAEKWVEWEGRFQNHFHNPLKANSEGLSDLQTQTQMSCLERAQSSAAQAAPDRIRPKATRAGRHCVNCTARL